MKWVLEWVRLNGLQFENLFLEFGGSKWSVDRSQTHTRRKNKDTGGLSLQSYLKPP